MIQKNKKKIICLILIIGIFTLGSFIYNKFILKTDGMEQSGVYLTKYRVYIDKKGWSEWSKNGLTSGDKKNGIRAVQIKLGKNDGVVYQVFTSKQQWEQAQFEDFNFKSDQNIRGIKMSLYYGTGKFYDICYRTYNSKNKWLEWNCENDTPSGNIDYDITAIQIKTIPKYVVKTEYLKDYLLNNNKINVGF